ncbi:MAG TPA: hypothetical protein VFY16_07085, partial [Gemmatimonadaceae bacterium]|nr:hypothetical protein [Gemmatimonadaceae bacterium]
LHPTRGLMAGQLTYPKPAAKCVDEFKRIRKVVERANPRLRKRDELKRDIPIVCQADAGPRLGSWLLYWGDSGSTQISQMMITGSKSILVAYKGPGADAHLAEQRANRGPAMQTFATFPWGVTRDSIVKRLGAPRAVDSTGGVYKLSYFDLLIGERAIVEFTVSPVEGLMSGIYWVPLPAGRDCEVFFRKFHFALVERFIDIKPEIARRNPRYGGFCAGVVEGTASLTAVWRDPKSTASVTSELQKPGKYVRIAYVGPPYVTWFQRTRSADVKSKF